VLAFVAEIVGADEAAGDTVMAQRRFAKPESLEGI
jgi:hypothetical protein